MAQKWIVTFFFAGEHKLLHTICRRGYDAGHGKILVNVLFLYFLCSGPTQYGVECIGLIQPFLCCSRTLLFNYL